MSNNHEPRPEFISQLEWQVRTSLRRHERFSEPVKPKTGGTMQMMVLVLASVLIGAGGVVVKDEVQESRAQEVLLASVESEIRLASLELEIVRTRFQEMERLSGLGLVDDEAIAEARLQVRQAELEVTRLALDREEIELTGREPRNEVSAPLVQDRDFVIQRLALQEAMAAEMVSMSERRASRYRTLVENGLIRPEAAAESVASLEAAQEELKAIHSRFDLRQRFLDGDLTGPEAETELQTRDLQLELDAVVRARKLATGQLQALEERAAAGLISEAEVRRARLQVMQRELELDLVQMKLAQHLSGGVTSGSPPSFP